jgi:hypothetical protein
VDEIAHNRSEGSSTPQFGAGRPTFGMARDQGRRIEIAFALKNGGLLTAIEELEDTLSAAQVARYAEQLEKDIAEGKKRTFTDGWAASGQHVWIDLREVAAFSLRPAK